jgi:adenylate cyclase
MRFEIERKFLVVHDGWRAAATHRMELRDGLIGQYARSKVRVRLDGGRAWITVKGARQGLGRPEFEYEIPAADAEHMLTGLCIGRTLEKTRSVVPFAGLSWTVDEFRGPLAGIVLAEVELEDENQDFTRPDWVGPEVTGDLRFRQSTLLHLCRDGSAVGLTEILALPEQVSPALAEDA